MVQTALNFNIYDCFTTKDMIFSGAFSKFILIDSILRLSLKKNMGKNSDYAGSIKHAFFDCK